MNLSKNQNALKYWYVPLIDTTSIRHALGRSPKGQSLLAAYTIQIIKLIMGLEVINLKQGRKLMNLLLEMGHLKNGTFLQSSKDKWATKVNGQGWNGYWIPFKDQSSKESLQAALKTNTNSADVGAGCDIVVMGIHGGGMVMGNALMFLANYRAWMKELHIRHGIKIGVLTIEYSLSPEIPFPGALNECVAAYRHLVEHQGIDPRRIIMAGDSAGANLCLTSAIKIRDNYPQIGMPAAQILFSPYVMSDKPLKDTPSDYITNSGVVFYGQAYTHNQPENLTSHFVALTRTPSFAGMPRMLVFVGGVETLRPSIETFLEKAKADGVELEVHIKDGMAHDYALVGDASGPKYIKEANETIGNFVAQIRDHYVKNSTAA
ncbi:hypothetical protein BGZ80_001479 [Entomortierella chlamydospora]|uniref:Alpha/beta hydrolase fold-3 domain-containing protein n=1 Tax=Entomortierella chlamydospora TaxID=101097 RepID=A0A9P6MQX9_9FUNG|nr:hypothetical protein BGZ80_001479 [Entomortierella chlamydospora]